MTISIAASGKPCYESLVFHDVFGTPQKPIIIEGNNAVFETNDWDKFRLACGQEKDSLTGPITLRPDYVHKSGKKFGLK